MSTPESKVKAKIKALLKARQIYYFMPATWGYGRSGVPDFVGCVDGHFFTIEAKAGKSQPTALQLREMRSIEDSGGTTFVINESNLDTLEAWLDTF